VRQPVVVSLVPEAELSAQLSPHREAGIRLRAVVTSAVALCGSSIRWRHRWWFE